MKKSILILATILGFACNKSTTAPVTPTTQNTTPIQNSLNSYEISLVANWKLWKAEVWLSNVPYPTMHNDTISCHLNLKSDFSTDGYKKSINALNCAGNNGNWKADDATYLNLDGFLYQIHKLTTDTLIISRGDLTTASGGSKYYLWK